MTVILVVDDQLAMRRMFETILAENDYEVDMAEDGAIAYDMATKKNYSLVITDYHMPNSNGIQLIKRLRNLSAYRNIPIIMVSTESNTNRKSEGRDAGATAWITKPIKVDTLLPNIERLLN